MIHAAMNLDTGDVITTSSVNYLKRLVRRTNDWNLRNGYISGRWVFSHGPNWRTDLQRRYFSC